MTSRIYSTFGLMTEPLLNIHISRREAAKSRKRKLLNIQFPKEKLLRAEKESSALIIPKILHLSAG